MAQADRTDPEQATAAPGGSRTRQPLTVHAPEMLPLARHPQRLTMPARNRRYLDQLWRALAEGRRQESGHGVAFLFVPVAMGAGAGLYYAAPADPPPLAIAAVLAVAVCVYLLSRQNHRTAARAASFAGALCAGALAAVIEARDVPVLLDSDVTTHITGTVEAREFDPDGRVRYLLGLSATSDPRLRRPPQRVRVTARSAHDPAPIGAVIAGRARLSSPSGPVLPGGYDYAFRAYIDRIGAHGYFYQAPARLDPSGAPDGRAAGAADSFRLALRTVREQISARIRHVLPGDRGGIAAALAVSDRRGISRATVDALRATGLAHILAISGLHMALAAGTLYIVIRKGLALFPVLVEAFAVKKLAAVGAMLTATAYLLISGGSVSTQRAWIMLTVMLFAVIADRPALTMRNVALAAIVIIVISPSAVTGPGFQMSFAATAALISAYAAIAGFLGRQAGSPKIPHARSALLRWSGVMIKGLIGLGLTSLVAGLATGLFSAHHFHRVAGYGLLANLMAMPLVTFVVMPAGLLALLLMPFGLDQWPLRLMGQGLEGVIAVARHVDALGGDIHVGQVPVQATLIAGAGFVVLVLLRSWLRFGGVVLLGLGAVLARPPFAAPGPDMLVSEDADLVALAGPATLASNSVRPSAFVFGQWQTALHGRPHAAPVVHKRPETSREGAVDGAEARAHSPPPAAIAATLDHLLAAAAQQPSRFQCAGRGLCAAVHKQAKILAIDQAAYIGAACDRADLVIVAIPVHMRICRSGATLVTSRSLRRTGALAIRIDPNTTAPQAASTDAAGSAARPEFQIRTALAGVLRPWTIQRYYNWRTGAYDLPDRQNR
ncbi:ComEC/Rec2 family competence protein [Hoeflea sp. YIM 152468]|uniref:ComEC/Rec2 family competence protein n=1 Tax=Hoeflea sp. YIM 152468 TaxID=3031759 RepID=UPI0023DA181F|nr:ComEC/Rec2 family competence protein [Hoeflea sp. YIM 152468]MDF1607343.1 ComEC/Rec2 family competence protein [Hoeflea sp. YIM 152468]